MIINEVRKKIIDWVNHASMEELLKVFPVKIELGLPSDGKVKRVLKRPRRLMTKKEGDEIRKRFGDIPSGTPEYYELRKKVCKEFGLTPTQVGKALSWRKRPQK